MQRVNNECDWWLDTNYHLIEIWWRSDVEMHVNRFPNRFLSITFTPMKYLLWFQSIAIDLFATCFEIDAILRRWCKVIDYVCKTWRWEVICL